MNTSIDTSPTSPKRPEPTLAPSSVSITHAASHDGRLPLTVTVTPLADLDASGGVFVDLRKGTKRVEAGASPNAEAQVELPDRPWTIAAGDAAIAELAALETGTFADLAKAQKTAFDAAQALSHQIGKGCKLTVGQAETYRVEVALPPDFDAADGWFVRCRFVSPDGDDLKSDWLRV